MTARVLLRDGSNLSDALVQRMLATYPNIPFVSPPGLGTGYSLGSVGIKNGASGANPNHFAVTADGTSRIVTARPGWVLVQQDNGATTFDPRVLFAQSTDTLTATATANATGSTRNDTVCLKLDMNTAPNADGSNLLSLVIVDGQSGGGISNAPSDGNVYVPLALLAVANGATTLLQSTITDKRYDQRIQAAMHQAAAQSIPNSTGTVIALDTIDSDPNGMCTTGAAAKITVPVAGTYAVHLTAGFASNAATAAAVVAFYSKNGSATGVDQSTISFTSGYLRTASTRLDLAAADYIQLLQQQNSGGSINTGAASSLVPKLALKWLGPA